jgi:hypothetical protein
MAETASHDSLRVTQQVVSGLFATLSKYDFGEGLELISERVKTDSFPFSLHHVILNGEPNATTARPRPE